MEMKSRFDHMNINVVDLERSMRFYERALGLKPGRRMVHPDGKFIIQYMIDSGSSFMLELTWIKENEGPYDLGDNETHLCMRMEGDYNKIRDFHRSMGCICYENFDMGLYFIEDPDGYWVEILPAAKD